MQEKVAIVTGANSGIGKVTAREIARSGYRVCAVCRNPEKGRQAVDEINRTLGIQRVELMICDFSSFESIRKFSEDYHAKYDRLDVLVNNAGAMFPSREFTADGYEMTFGVNHMGYFLTTHYLLDLLLRTAPARIVNVSSFGHRLARMDWNNLNAEKRYIPLEAYNQSKLANILFTRKLAAILEGSGVTCNALHPGAVNSNFGGRSRGLYKFVLEMSRNFLISPEKGAETSIFLALSPKVEGKTGGYYSSGKRRIPSWAARNKKDADRLWTLSLQMAGIETFGKLEE